jgi:hypothetical protein
MPPDETTQNSTSETNSKPISPQESTEPASENTRVSEPSEATPEPQNAQGEVFEPKVESEPLPENGNIESKPESSPEPKNEPKNAPETPMGSSSAPVDGPTAQIPVNELFEQPQDKPLAEPENQNEQAKPVRENSKSSFARELLIKARNAIQFRKRKKLDRVMSMFLKQSKITNDEVEKFLHVSDATATRYLSELEKEGKIKQNGKTGKGVSYSRI